MAVYISRIFCLTLCSCTIAFQLAVAPAVFPSEKSAEAPSVSDIKGKNVQAGVSFVNGTLSIDVKDISITDLLKTIAEKTKINLTIGDGLAGNISLKLTNVSVEEALKQLCINRTMVFQYDPATKSYSILSAGVFVSQKGAGVTTEADQAKVLAQTSRKPAASSANPDRSSANAPERLYDSKGRLLYKPRELLVKFKKGTTVEQMESLHRVLGSIVIRTILRYDLQQVIVRDGISEKEAAALYRASDIVVSVNRNALRHIETTPNDPSFNQQWGPVKINLPQAWDNVKDCPDVTIAVIDTGIDYNHPDLTANIWRSPVDNAWGWDFYNNNNDPIDSDTVAHGHGTHIAGIIAARGNNRLGIAGVCWTAKLMALKVEINGSLDLDSGAIINAISYAIENGARIVNCSFGGEGTSPDEYDAYIDLKNAGILVVCAAGNSNLDMDTAKADLKIYPAYYAHSQDPSYPPLDNIISVAASNQFDDLLVITLNSIGSNYGARSVDVAAPGADIYSTLPPLYSGGPCTDSDTGCYGIKSGTSMATPFVSGIAGLILAKNPNLNYLAVKSAILNTVDKPAFLQGKVSSNGRVNAAAALASIIIYGDITGDNRVKLDDAIIALQVLSSMQPTGLDAARLAAGADISGDQKIGLAEVIYILQKIAGIRE